MSHPMQDREHEFRIIVIGGMLLSLNCGFLNGATLLRDRPRTTTHLTGNATRFGIAIANLDLHDIYFYGGLILVYTCGSVIAGSFTPSQKFSVSNGYGRVLILSSILILLASLMAIFSEENKEIFNMTVAAAVGIQNGALSRYSGNIIRVGHVTGGCVDIGVHLGRYVMGNKDNMWKIEILVSLVFWFWLGGVLVELLEPVLDDRILLVNVGYMLFIATTYMVYWHVMGLNTSTELQNELLGDKNDLVVNTDPREKSEACLSFSSAVTSTEEKSKSLVFVNEADSDFNLTQDDIDQLHLSTRPPSAVTGTTSATTTSSVAPVSLQDREAKEFSFIMIGSSLLALNAGCINAIAVLSSRELFVTHVTGSLSGFAITAFSFDDSTRLMESTLLIASFIFGAFLVGMMSSTSVFRLGISYGRILCLVSAFFIAASISQLFLPGSMLYYCFSAMGCGAQNGMITKYSGGVIRTTNVTGSFADIGGILGRMLKGNYADSWQLKVLIPLVFSFVVGGAIGSFLSDALEEYAPVVNAIFMVIVSVAYIIGLKQISGTELTYSQLITGKYTYPEIKKKVRNTINRGNSLIRETFRRSNSKKSDNDLTNLSNGDDSSNSLSICSTGPNSSDRKSGTVVKKLIK